MAQRPLLEELGIIPARAGFTRTARQRPPTPRDHPRSRGVYKVMLMDDVVKDGSSPLARGLLSKRPPSGDTYGIIPARAGFTTSLRRLRPPLTDHPRSRGVYSERRGATVFVSGSSPLARGLQPHRRKSHGSDRIIPARAGFTLRALPTRPLDGDHPRSRGVYKAASSTSHDSTGSSPLARGLHSLRVGRSPTDRIIPARAGFTLVSCRRAAGSRDHPRSRGVYWLPRSA